MVLGKSFRRAKVAGSYGLGRNYIMMRLKEVGEIPKDQVAIRRMVVSTCPSPETFQLSFRQRLCLFFLWFFLENYRDFADDDKELLDGIVESVVGSGQLTDSSSGGSELFDEVDLLFEETNKAEGSIDSTTGGEESD